MAARFRISWSKIVERIGSSNLDDLYFFTIPDAGRLLLMSNFDRLNWEATYDVDGYDYSDTDERHRIVQLTYDALMENEPMSEISDAIRYLADNLELVVTVDNSNENSNVASGGGGGCCSDFDTPTDTDGQPYPLIPVTPSDPLEEINPTWDDANQIPPDGYDSWQQFIDGRCLAANWFVDSFVTLVENADLAERQLSAGEGILEVAVVLTKALPGPVAEWAGTVILMKWLLRAATFLASATGNLEELNDYLQLAADKIQENKQEYVCAAYTMSSVEYLEQFFTTFFGGYISPELEAAGASTDVVDATREFVRPLAEELAKRAAQAFANQQIPEDYVPSIDCESCAQTIGDYRYIPAVVQTVQQVRTSATTQNANAVIEGGGASVRLETEGVNIGSNPWTEFDFTLSAPPANAYIVGIQIEYEPIVNVQEGKHRFGPNENVPEDIISITINTWSSGVNEFIHDGEDGVYVPQGDNVLYNNNLNALGCAKGHLSAHAGFNVASNGPGQLRIKNIRWVEKVSGTCV